MTDTSTSPTPAPTSTTSNLGEQLNSVLRAAPELNQSPGTAVAVAGSADPVGNAQAVARGTQAISTAQAGNRVAKSAGSGSGVFGWLGHVATSTLDDIAQAPAAIGSAAMTGLEDVGTTLNKPLSVVQHEYRYVHDVEARYGPEAALAASLGLVGGGAVGFAAGGLSGAVLGGEAAEALEGQFLYHDSWNNTANGNTYRDPHTHQAVSIGRDIASVISGTRTGVEYNGISAVIDGLFDMTADPLSQAGSLVGQAKSLEGASRKLGDLFSGTGIRAGSAAPEDVERIVRQYPGVRNAFDQIAGMTSGQIAARYPALSPVAQRLGQASTPDEVQQVFEQVSRAGELITTDRLPSMSFTHLALQKVRYGMANAQPVGDLVGQVTNSSKLARLGDVAEHVVGPSTLMRRFERMPAVYNPDNFQFSAREFAPGSDYAANAVYQLLRYGESPHVAEDVVTEYLNTPNLGRRIQIYRNAVINALAAKAHVDPAQFGEYANDDTRSAIKEALDTLTRGSLPGVSGHYGNAMDARDLSHVVTDDGALHSAAVLPNQTGNLRIPSAREFRNAAQVLKGARDTWGKIDDFAYRNVTQSVFKRLVLLSMSYAEHISLAEIIPNGLREGFTGLIRSGIQLNRALGPLSDEDAELHVGAIRSLVYKLLRMDRGEVPDNDDVQLAARYVQALHGELLPAAIDSGHNISNEVKDIDQTEHLFRSVYANSPKALQYSKDFTEYGRTDEHFVDAWQKVLHEMSLQPDNEVVRKGAAGYLDAARSGASQEEATRRAVGVMTDHLSAQPENWLSQYERHYLHSSTEPAVQAMSPEEDWSRVMAEHLKGATHSADGRPNVSLLSHIANGEKVPTDELDAIGTNDRPLVVKGRQMVSSGEGALNRITNAIANPIFGKILNPFVNLMSRESLAFQEFKHQWSLVKDADTMTDDEKMVTAMHRTATRSVRFVHNLNDRTQWTDTMRNWAPFYFAQEQAYRRMARMLAENPGAFRRYQMMISALQNVSARQQAANGQEYVVLPGTGFLTSGVVNLLARIGGPFGKQIESATPVGMGWDISAANVIFPMSNGFRPDVGPVLTLPAEIISDIFPEQASPSIKSSLTGVATEIGGPDATEPIWEQLIPNTIVQRLAVAANANSSTFDSAFISTLQSLEYHHDMPPEGAGPVAMQNFLDKVRNQTRILFVMKALVGAAAPTSPELQAQDFNFPAELEADINKTGSYTAGVQEFLVQHPDATPWTVFRSTSTAGVSPLSTQPAENWVNDNMGLINQYGYAALYFMPQLKNGTYSPEVYNEQVAQSLRVKYAPQQFLNQLYIMGANDTYYSALDKFDSSTANMSGTEFYNAEQNFLAWEAGFAAQHPVWSAQYYTPGDFASDRQTSSDRTQAIIQMREMIAKNVAPAGSLTDGIKTLLGGYDSYVSQIAVGKQDNYSSTMNQQITDNWQSYLTQTAKSDPELATVINGVFMYAPKSGVSGA